jgi:hypothetical protein
MAIGSLLPFELHEMPLALAKMVKTVVPVRKAPAVLLTPPRGEEVTVIRPPLANLFWLADVTKVTEFLVASYVAEETATGWRTVTRCLLTFLVDVQATW